jgi:hypothetical protein
MRRLMSSLALLGTVCAARIAKSQAAVPPDATVDRDLVFARFGNQTLSLDLYRPRTRVGKVPIVV